MTGDGVALSIKQPWATLIVAGVKTIEIRTWSTTRRGPIFLHAARVPDNRPHGWSFVTDELRDATTFGGGIIGVAELVDCLEYRDVSTFAADRARHRNHADWFRPPVLYGFVLDRVRPLPFHRLPGNTGFFKVQLPAPVSQPSPLPKPTAEIAVPPPLPRVIIIDPPEGQEALHHDAHHPPRSAR